MSFNLNPSSLFSSSSLAGLGVPGIFGGSIGGLAQGAASWLGDSAGFLGSKPTADAATLLPLVLQMLQSLASPSAGDPAGASAGHGAAPAPGGGAAKGGAGKRGGAKGGGKTEKLDGPGGFLWKPVSDSNGKLVVLLPPKLAGQAKSVEVQDASGKTLAQGRYTGDANGGRPHFRFDKPGAAYGNDLRVVATLADGSKVNYSIKSGAARND